MNGEQLWRGGTLRGTMTQGIISAIESGARDSGGADALVFNKSV